MKIRTKLFLFLFILFSFISTFIWMYSKQLSEKTNEEWADRYIQNQIIFDKSRTLLPIMREVALVKQMAKNSDILAMASNDGDSLAQQKGIEALESYRLKFQDRSYFAAFTKSQNYYFNNYANEYEGKQRIYTLSKAKTDDKWFFDAIEIDDEYQINVNKDTLLGTTKVWINFLLKEQNKTVGIIGTGLDLSQFLKESVGIQQEGVHNLFINKKMAIQLDRDTKLIDYSSLSKSDEQHNTLSLLLKNKEELKRIKEAMRELELSRNENATKTLWIQFNNKKQLIGIAYLKELGWYSITLIDSKNLSLMDNLNIFIFLSMFFLALLLVISFVYNILLLKPLHQLKQIMNRVEHGKYDIDIPTIGTGEIAELSKQFKSMLEFVRKNSDELEEKIHERTLTLRDSEQKLIVILESIEGYIYIKDRNYKYTYANKKVCELFNMSIEDIIGKDDSAFFDEQTAKEIRVNDTKVFESGKKIETEEINTNVSGLITKAFLSVKTPLFREDGSIYALCGISTDITERKRAEEEIHHLAFYDTLTALPNRRFLNEQLTHALASANRTHHYGAVMFLDLDNFKPLNDKYGHEVGDLLLIETANRIKACLREVDIAARYGGDEFVILFDELSGDINEALQKSKLVAEKIRLAIEQTFVLNVVYKDEKTVVQHHSTASIGIALFIDNSVTKDDLLDQADKAMYSAKESGRNRICFFNKG